MRSAEQVWTVEQARHFLTQVRDDRLAAAYRLAVTRGLRRGEVCGLRIGDLDLERGTVMVRRSYDGDRYGDTKTRSSPRRIALGTENVAALPEHLRRQLEERLVLGLGRPGPDDPLFTNPNGQPLDPQLLRRQFRAHTSAGGLPYLRFHGLRHTAATLALALGEHPKVVAQMLGHSSVTLTLDLYSHVSPIMAAESADRVDQFLSG